MHSEGHVGVNFLLYAPAAYLFVTQDWMLTFAFGAIGMGVWATLPDIDMTLPIPHRGPTHSFLFAAAAGTLTGILFGYGAMVGVLELTSLRSSAWPLASVAGVGIGFAVGFVGVTGHLLGDVLTPMGVRPWWPRSGRSYSLEMVLAADEEANKRLSMIGAVALTIALVIGKVGNPFG